MDSAVTQPNATCKLESEPQRRYDAHHKGGQQGSQVLDETGKSRRRGGASNLVGKTGRTGYVRRMETARCGLQRYRQAQNHPGKPTGNSAKWMPPEITTKDNNSACDNDKLSSRERAHNASGHAGAQQTPNQGCHTHLLTTPAGEDTARTSPCRFASTRR